MQKIMVAVRDRAAQCYAQPFVVPRLEVAIRMFKDEANREQGDMFSNPNDFELWVIGHFDDITGMVVAVTPELIKVAKDVKSVS